MAVVHGAWAVVRLGLALPGAYVAVALVDPIVVVDHRLAAGVVPAALALPVVQGPLEERYNHPDDQGDEVASVHPVAHLGALLRGAVVPACAADDAIRALHRVVAEVEVLLGVQVVPVVVAVDDCA